MKKLIALAVTGLLAVAPASALAAKKGVRQEMQGEITAPTPYPADGTCFSRLARTTNLASSGAVNGPVGFTFDIDPRTAGKKFQLHVTGGSDDVDMDLVYYASLGSLDDPNTAPAFQAYETRETGGEAGVVPPGMTKAVVCMAAGSQGAFHYMAGKGIK
jgi:hypothetical protein